MVWVRATETLPDDPALHACAATYVSDLMLLATALLPHRLMFGDPRLQMASLDHAVWFHAPFRADDWLCYQQESPWAGNARALCRGSLFDRGRHAGGHRHAGGADQGAGPMSGSSGGRAGSR